MRQVAPIEFSSLSGHTLVAQTLVCAVSVAQTLVCAVFFTSNFQLVRTAQTKVCATVSFWNLRENCTD